MRAPELRNLVAMAEALCGNVDVIPSFDGSWELTGLYLARDGKLLEGGDSVAGMVSGPVLARELGLTVDRGSRIFSLQADAYSLRCQVAPRLAAAPDAPAIARADRLREKDVAAIAGEQVEDVARTMVRSIIEDRNDRIQHAFHDHQVETEETLVSIRFSKVRVAGSELAFVL